VEQHVSGCLIYRLTQHVLHLYSHPKCYVIPGLININIFCSILLYTPVKIHFNHEYNKIHGMFRYLAILFITEMICIRGLQYPVFWCSPIQLLTGSDAA
jgi:hypothetical protein